MEESGKANGNEAGADLAAWLRDRRVLVIGLGTSGRSAAAFCASRGAQVLAYDSRPLESLPDADALRELGSDVEIHTGSQLPDLADFDLVVPSPGVPKERYAAAGLAWGDIELTARSLSVPIVAVTGTNGKSTTVRLVEAMLRGAGLRARAAGNIGAAALDLVGEALDVAVLEVSSFQLEAVDSLRPRVAVVLNLTPDHLDRHGSFEAYLEAKAQLLARQQANDFAVLNLDDPAVRGLATRTQARVVGFSRRGPVRDGAYVDAGAIVLARDGVRSEVPIDRSALPGLDGVHNLENLLAAFATVQALGLDPSRAAQALLAFEGLPHRCEQVATAMGVAFVDDSKATNPGAAARSLESFGQTEARVLWIAGGRGKGAGLESLAKAAVGRARAAFLIGEAAGEIESALEGRVPVARCASIEDAVNAAAKAARPGDIVLLAPGCASFDQFSSAEERGERFAAAARDWAADHAEDTH